MQKKANAAASSLSERMLRTLRAVEPPIGTIITVAGQVTAEMKRGGWLECKGQALSRAKFPELASVVGDSFGSAPRGSFRLPDLRGRFVLGAGKGGGLTRRKIGDKLGSEAHALSLDELARHEHLVAAHNHQWTTAMPSGYALGTIDGAESTFDRNGNLQNIRQYQNRFTSVVSSLETERTLPSRGNGRAHNNMPPAIALVYAIKCRSAFVPAREP